MKISGMQKLTLLDYPGKTACLLFTQGCNFRCPFCHNKDLLSNENAESMISEEEIFQYLEKRKGLIDGVCISGGEPLLQEDIDEFISKIRQMGFSIKIDTNGSSPSRLKRLIDKNLIDYVAMDVKNDFLNYDKTSGVERLNIENIKRSIKIIEESNIEYEFRTTLVREFHKLGQLEKICEYLGPKAKYYLQNYRDCNSVLQMGLSGFEKEELLNMQNQLKITYPNVMVRGI